MSLNTLSNRELVSLAERDPRADTDPLFAALVQRLRRAPEEDKYSNDFNQRPPLLPEVRRVR